MEADDVTRLLRRFAPDARQLLELGAGTGRHGRLLAERGFRVLGIERSEWMVSAAVAAGRATPIPDGAGSFEIRVGDIRDATLDRDFDAVVSLFHVISYQTMDQDLSAAFATAARHLRPGGVFLFDVWHGPAVVKQGCTVRVKEVEDEETSLYRRAEPVVDEATHSVTISYTLHARSKVTGLSESVSEQHRVRYLFPAEVESLAAAASLEVELMQELGTGRPPSEETWSIAYLLRRRGRVGAR